MAYKLKNITITLLILIFSANQLYCTGNETPIQCDSLPISDSFGPDGVKLGVLLIAGTAAFIGGMYVQRIEYWGNNGEFHIMPLDLEYNDALMADKFGHLYFTYAASKISSSLFQWAEIDTLSSLWIGSSIALGVQTLNEIQDGFSHGASYLGFSVGDVGANILGAAWPILEHKYPLMKNFKFKVSLDKSSMRYKNKGINLLKDYEGRFNWISINVHNMLPSSWQNYYPSFVNLAIGFGVKDINRYGSGYHELYIALDWNLTENKNDHFIESFLKQFLNLYHLPAPAVRLYPDVVWYGLKY